MFLLLFSLTNPSLYLICLYKLINQNGGKTFAIQTIQQSGAYVRMAEKQEQQQQHEQKQKHYIN